MQNIFKIIKITFFCLAFLFISTDTILATEINYPTVKLIVDDLFHVSTVKVWGDIICDDDYLNKDESNSQWIDVSRLNSMSKILTVDNKNNISKIYCKFRDVVDNEKTFIIDVPKINNNNKFVNFIIMIMKEFTLLLNKIKNKIVEVLKHE